MYSITKQSFTTSCHTFGC